MILVDTSIWIPALKPGPSQEELVLRRLLDQDLVATTDVIIAEVLQGARSDEDYGKLADTLEAPVLFHADEATWRKAARLSYELKARGLRTPLADVVIATVALDNDLEVYAADDHFLRVQGLKLHMPS